MAIIDEATIEDGKKIQELKTIDINDTSLLEGATENINPDADAWERACPPPDGTYKVAIFEAKVPYQQGKTDDGQIYYVANLETKIMDNEGWKDTRIFAKVSTIHSSNPSTNGKKNKNRIKPIMKKKIDDKFFFI